MNFEKLRTTFEKPMYKTEISDLLQYPGSGSCFEFKVDKSLKGYFTNPRVSRYIGGHEPLVILISSNATSLENPSPRIASNTICKKVNVKLKDLANATSDNSVGN